MRILWMSNAPWAPSGYGEQTALFAPRIKAMGHDVAVAANFGLQGAKLVWEGLDIYPFDGNENTTLVGAGMAHDAELIMVLYDSWVLKPDMWPEGIPPVAIWAPVDHQPIPPAVTAVLAHHRVRPIAMSRFGETEMRNAGLDPFYVPHGVNTELFKPDPSGRQQMRDQLKIPQDVFLVLMVGANSGHPAMSRKGYPQALDGFARFARDHDDVWLWAHTKPMANNGGGMDLAALAEAVGCPANRTKFTPPTAWYVPPPSTLVAGLYQAADVLLQPSMGEGFGIPLLEAQASGTPVITSDHSAMSELCDAGWLVGGERWWDPASNAFFHSPSIAHIHGALEIAYLERDNQQLQDQAVQFAQQYAVDKVAEEHWEPVLETLGKPREVGPLTFHTGNGKVAANRQQRRALARAKQ